MVTLRNYQKTSLIRLSDAYRAGANSVCYVLPTGGGKTICAAYVAEQHLKRPDNHFLFVAHREELITQAAQKMRAFGLKTRCFVGGKMDGPFDARVTVAMVQSLQRADNFPCLPSMVCFDEGHHAPADSYQFVKSRLPDTAKFLFITATPERSDGKPMGDVCDELIVACQPIDLILHNKEFPDEGLVDCRVMSTKENLRPGAHAERSSDAFLRLAPTSKAVIFAPSIEYSLEEVDRLKARGVAAAHVDGTMSGQTRRILLDRLASGELQVISNVNLLTEGWDLPALSTAIVARNCGSTGLWLQICGRIMRPFPGKTHGMLIDLTGAFWLHGLPSEDREYSLTGKAISRSCPDDQLPVHYRCKECLHQFDRRLHEVCPHCGSAIIREKTKLQIKNEHVSEITAMQAANRKRGDEWLFEQVKKYVKIAQSKGYSPYWATHRVKVLTGIQPSQEMIRQAVRSN